MDKMDLTVSDALLESIKETLRIRHDSLNDDIENIIVGGLAEIQSKVGPLSFESDSLTSKKALNLLRTFCFYSWNDMSQDFEIDNRHDILSLQMCIIQYGR